MECPSRPVCMLPIRTRLGRVPMDGPRESGSNRCGKCGACTLCSDFDSSLSRTTSLESAAAAAAEENDDAALHDTARPKDRSGDAARCG